jgi:hypothetical protein
LHVAPCSTDLNHGKSQEEATSEDVETQTPQAPQGEPPQEAHLAKIVGCAVKSRFFDPPVPIGGFFVVSRGVQQL